MFNLFNKKPSIKLAIIMIAIPGSGKSTFAQHIQAVAHSQGMTCTIHSSDEKFMVDGEYKFDQSLLGKYHHQNQDDFKQAAEAGTNVVIADNTNIKRKDYMEYVKLAKDSGYKVVAITFVPSDAEMHFRRNVHSVPLDVVERMKASLEATLDAADFDERYTMECHDGILESEYAKCIIKAVLA